MSILIKGIDMPKDGYHHRIVIYSDGSVATGAKNDYTAVEIPTPHGRLIDKDAMPKGETFGALMWEIDHAPTILEAEE